MPGLRVRHGGGRDRAVEGDEPAAPPHGERQQADVGDLFGTKDAVVGEDDGVERGQVIRQNT
jgi:hypothetical protein